MAKEQSPDTSGAQAAEPDPPARRAEDAAILLFGADRSAQALTADLGSFQPTPQALANAAFLIDLGTDDALIVPAAEAHLLPRGQGGEELQQRAAAMAQALRRERDWVRRRLQMPDFLLGYAERLQQADTEAQVYEALREVATPVVGAFTAVLYVSAGEVGDAVFHPLADTSLRLPFTPLPAETVMLFVEQRLVTRAEVEAAVRSPLAPLASILDAAEGWQLLCSPVGPDALLILVERRRDRVLTGEDRDLLAALVRQAEAALRRIVSERQVAALAFTDPVTGLPSGRHVELIVEHALARAQRGHPLAVVLVDLEHAHPDPRAADSEEALYWLASAMTEQLRRTDLALRHSGERFMMVLTDTDAAGARTVIKRLEQQTGSAMRLSSGVAVYGPGRDTAEELERAAAVDLESGTTSPPD